MFVGVTIVCVVFGLVVQPAEKQRQAIEALRLYESDIYYDYHFTRLADGTLDQLVASNAPPPGPKWLRDLIGVDYFANVVWVDLTRERMTSYSVKMAEATGYDGEIHVAGDEALRQLKHFKKLESLTLGSYITDQGIEYLDGLPQLRSLTLLCPEITGDGLRRLTRISSLRDLTLGSMSELDLKNLVGLTQLRRLTIFEFSGTAGEVTSLRSALPNCTIDCAVFPNVDDLPLFNEGN